MDMSMIHLVGVSVASLFFGVVVSAVSVVALCGVLKCIIKSRSPKAGPGMRLRTSKPSAATATTTTTDGDQKALDAANGRHF